MKTKYRKAIILTILAFTLIAASIFALTDPNIPRHFTGAGGESSGGSYTLTGSIGQHDAGVTLTDGEYKLSGGFWGAGAGRIVPVYLPLLVR